jgi:hypothetical protein
MTKLLLTLFLLALFIDGVIQNWTKAPVSPGKPGKADVTVSYWSKAPTAKEWAAARKRNEL